jgi:two-component system chemotaxis sensor kinase CheA
MPVMDGLELTSRLRADARHRDLPIVLVTSRDAREDRERGIQAGADAYIVKGAFDQDRLLDTIRRLT